MNKFVANFKKCKLFNFNNKHFSLNSQERKLKLNHYLIKSDKEEVKKTLVFLHGLFGNANNWRSISYSEPIKARRHSLLVDLRNHGLSEHDDAMDYSDMADDVVRLLDELNLNKITLLGHSMGAKVAMNLACRHEDRLDGLIIVDAAPKDNKEAKEIYNTSKNVIDKLSNYNINGKTRKEVLNDFKEMFVYNHILLFSREVQLLI